MPENPTSRLIARLRANSTTNADGSDADLDVIEARVLETSADAVREGITDIYGQLNAGHLKFPMSSKEDATQTEGDEPEEDAGTTATSLVVVVMHLGVNYRGERFHLEQCAYDEATFRVPDENGYIPHESRILSCDDNDPSSPALGRRIDTALDINRLCRSLSKNETRKSPSINGEAVQEVERSHDVTISVDPGRFVCNYIYCLSLDQCRQFSEAAEISATATDRKSGSEAAALRGATSPSGEVERRDTTRVVTAVRSLFVHVPPFEVTPEDEQLEFIMDLMRAIERQVCAEGDGKP